MVALGGYLAKTLLYNLALSLSHKATFQILRDIRKMVLSKMPRLPLGDILDTSSGRLKQIVVDQVESMETTLAHLLPEMTSNLLAPVCVLVYLFTLDWRMALLSLVSIPVGMAFMMAIMGSYGKDYQGAVETTRAMNETIVEYIGGIEVIKAFNQGKNSYEKFSSRVRANAAYYYNWMKKCQFGMALAYAIAPTTLITVLPVGWIFYTDGSLSAEVFLTTIILSMSIVGPLIAAMGFVDHLAKVGTIVGSVDEILLKPEQDHGTQPARLGKPDIALDRVSFGYAQDKEIIHNISLTIPAGSLTALVGPSGSGKSTIARAMLKNAPVVILAEATANVDPENEDRLQKAVEALTQDKTILMIAHRLKTVRNADQILMLDGGQIVQRGTHSQLMAQEGLYRAFVSGRKESGQWKL